MTALDDAVERLQLLIQEVLDANVLDIGNLWQLIGAGGLGSWEPADRQAIIAALRQYVPDLVIGSAALAADFTAVWYDDLAPAEPFAAQVPEDLVSAERIAASISWAVNTATSAQTALAQLQGSMQRAVVDAQRATVAHNAAREGIRYRRHTNYAGACNWCLTMATRGAVYTSAASAVRGHDHCKCIAVPERSGTTYTVPAMVRHAEKRYAEASRQLAAEGAPVTLEGIIKRMDGVGVTASALGP